jgi:hypothetical protein
MTARRSFFFFCLPLSFGPELPLSCGRRATSELPGFPLSYGQREILIVPGLPLCCGQRVIFEVRRFLLSLGSELPLSCGQRVTFFAGAKKVTKETPSESELAQEEPIRFWIGRAESHGQLGFLTLTREPLDYGDTHSDCRAAMESRVGCALLATELVNLRWKNRPGHSSRNCRFVVGQTWARSDSKRCFFGDFLCTSKESYPLAAGQRKLWNCESYPLTAGQRKLRHCESYPRATGQQKRTNRKRSLREEVRCGASR